MNRLDPNTILEMTGITKNFPGVLALDDVSLEIKRGEVLALIGENGAGKSTLMKILSGAFSADKGKVIIDGEEIRSYSPKLAIEKGISIMYQELNYVKYVSVAENIFLGMLPRRGLFIDYKRLKTESEKYLKQVGLNCDPLIEVGNLSIAEKQIVEIAKAISKDFKVLIMDEPTSALNDEETKTLFSIVKKLAKEGKAIIYISHRLDEIFSISDRVMVMRDGRRVGLLKTSDTTKHELIKMMVGREINEMYPMGRREIGECILDVEGLSTNKVKNVSLKVNKGEIVGLFGLMGSGRTNIVESIFGIHKRNNGIIKMFGRDAGIQSPRFAIRAGIGYVPSERKTEGLILGHPVKDNITLTFLDKLIRNGFLNLRKEKIIVKDWVKKLNIKTPHIGTLAESLSGGNQQKIVLAKWMITNPSLLILNEPTKGIDVGAKVEIYKLMEDLCRKGLGILVVSSELPEIMAISDRIITVCEGRVTGEYKKEEVTQEKLLSSAIGEVSV